MEEQKKVKKQMNLPNKISLFRFICAPIMIVLFLVDIPYALGTFLALLIYIVGCLSDAVDGKIAKKYNLITDFGKFIDQIADKFLQTSGLILVVITLMMYPNSIMPTWLGMVILLIIILRDIMISGVRQIAASKGVVIPADMFGRIKSFVIDVSTIVLLFYIGLVQLLPNGDASKLWFLPINYIYVLGFALLIVGTLLSLLSCINYMKNAWPLVMSDALSEPKSTENDSSEVKLLTASGKESVSKQKQQAIANEKYKNEKVIKTSAKEVSLQKKKDTTKKPISKK